MKRNSGKWSAVLFSPFATEHVSPACKDEFLEVLVSLREACRLFQLSGDRKQEVSALRQVRDERCRSTTWDLPDLSPATLLHAMRYIFLGGLFYLQLGLFYFLLVFVTYGGLFCLRLKFGLVFFTYG